VNGAPDPAEDLKDLSVRPVLPLMCFRCVTAACRHEDCPGNIPALTAYQGTLLCADCAELVAAGK
jgi:hypothetical protein